MGGCDITAKYLGLVELQEMSNWSRPLDTGSGDESRQLETLAHEGCTRTQLNVGVGPGGVGTEGSPVRVRFRMELGCLATFGHTPVGEEDDGACQGARESRRKVWPDTRARPARNDD